MRYSPIVITVAALGLIVLMAYVSGAGLPPDRLPILGALLVVCVLAGIVALAVGRPGEAVPAGRHFVLTSRIGNWRFVLVACFWLWGLSAGFYALSGLVEAERLEALGVGTSAAVTMRIGAWIGGMLLFGLGALLAPATSVVEVGSEAG